MSNADEVIDFINKFADRLDDEFFEDLENDLESASYKYGWNSALRRVKIRLEYMKNRGDV